MAAIAASWKTTLLGFGLMLGGVSMEILGTGSHNALEYVVFGVGLVLARDA